MYYSTQVLHLPYVHLRVGKICQNLKIQKIILSYQIAMVQKNPSAIPLFDPPRLLIFRLSTFRVEQFADELPFLYITLLFLKLLKIFQLIY